MYLYSASRCTAQVHLVEVVSLPDASERLVCFKSQSLVVCAVESDLTSPGEEVACAVCAQSTILPQQASQVEFSLTWDMPVIHFGSKENVYRRSPTAFSLLFFVISGSFLFYISVQNIVF
jgi:uncharacterized protein (DUF608 family)